MPLDFMYKDGAKPMTITVYMPNDGNTEHGKVLAAMAYGCGANILPLEEYNVENSPDIAIVFGVYKPKVPYSAFRGRILECQKYLNKRTIVVEKGFVKRDEYYSVGFDGLNRRANFCNNGIKDFSRFKKMGIRLLPMKNNKDGHVLICSQVPWDANVYQSNHIKWLIEIQKKAYLLCPNNEIRLRIHPLYNGQEIPILEGIVPSKNKDIVDDLKDAKVTVTWNSNAAVDSLLNGIPAISFDEGSMAYSVTDHFAEFIPNPTIYDRGIWARELAYTQWNISEMRNGDPIEHLLKNSVAKEKVA